MTRSGWFAALLAAGVLTFAGSTLAQDEADAAEGAADRLPVTRLVLFTSGVGYFEHTGTVSGTEEIELSIATEDMNDLLQSLVLQDFDGGAIRPVRYPSRDPLDRILAGYSFDLTGDPTLADLLRQARGETVRVRAADTLVGTIVNVEHVQPPEAEARTYLTLSTPDGLRRLALSEVREIRFESEALQAELEAALEALARHRGRDQERVRLRFEGEGERRVSVGYVREMPVWKTSYRLVVRDDGEADLQGWAILDNPTHVDLEEVSVAFVAGQPISFVTELYEPVYVDRPRVSVDVGPTIVPEADAGDAPPPAAMQEEAAGLEDRAMSALRAPQPAEAAPRLGGAGVQAMAEGARAGATFAYRVREPVTVGRHESAMVPIVQTTVEARSLSLFDASVLPAHPLRGVRLVNDTGLHLASGTVSVFDEGGFTGNARLGEVVPGDARLLTYAVDLDVEVERRSESEPEEVTAVRLIRGALETTQRQRVRTTYRVAPRAEIDRFLVIEHPKRDGFEIVRPEDPAETQDAYRFGVALEHGGAEEPEAGDAGGEAEGDPVVPTHLRCEPEEACALEVVVERTTSRTLAVGNVTPDQIGFYLENVELSENDRATLERILELKRRIVNLDRAISERQTRIEEIHREQDRIRQNMSALDRNSSLYQRYVSDLESQENQIEGLRREIEELRGERRQLQSELDGVVELLSRDAAPE